jgi:hypothetical protein
MVFSFHVLSNALDNGCLVPLAGIEHSMPPLGNQSPQSLLTGKLSPPCRDIGHAIKGTDNLTINQKVDSI